MNIKDGCSILNNKTIIGYSIKTNNLPFLIKYLNKQNICTEIVSSDEYKYVRKLGIKNKNIIYNGPMKDKRTLITAIKFGAIINVETFRESIYQNLKYYDEVIIEMTKNDYINFLKEQKND